MSISKLCCFLPSDPAKGVFLPGAQGRGSRHSRRASPRLPPTTVAVHPAGLSLFLKVLVKLSSYFKPFSYCLSSEVNLCPSSWVLELVNENQYVSRGEHDIERNSSADWWWRVPAFYSERRHSQLLPGAPCSVRLTLVLACTSLNGPPLPLCCALWSLHFKRSSHVCMYRSYLFRAQLTGRPAMEHLSFPPLEVICPVFS